MDGKNRKKRGAAMVAVLFLVGLAAVVLWFFLSEVKGRKETGTEALTGQGLDASGLPEAETEETELPAREEQTEKGERSGPSGSTEPEQSVLPEGETEPGRGWMEPENLSEEEYLKVNKENIARQEFAENFHPAITGFKNEAGHDFPFDESAIQNAAGWYLYSLFGAVEITELRFDEFLAEWEGGCSYHVMFVEPNREETPGICTYYSNEIGSAYNFCLTER